MALGHITPSLRMLSLLFLLSLSFSLSQERIFLTLSNYIFTAVFLAEMTVKVMGRRGGEALVWSL